MRSEPSQPTKDIPQPLRQLLALFGGRLVDVHFPGVDIDTLVEASDRFRARGEAVDDARQALDEALKKLDEELDEVRRLGRRALAYAEVYAEGDAALLEELRDIRTGLGIDEGGAKKKSATTKRRRKKKAAGPELPLDGGANVVAAHAG